MTTLFYVIGHLSHRGKRRNSHQQVAEFARVLIEAKADVNTESSAQETPLAWSVVCGSVLVTQVLIDAKANVNSKPQGLTPLHIAVKHSPACIAQLVAAGAKIRKSKHGYNALHEAVAADIPDERATQALKLLRPVSNFSERVNEVGFGTTPLSLAATHGLKSAVQFLIEQKANVNQATNGCAGHAALRCAVTCGRLAIAKQLVSYGACVHPVLNLEGTELWTLSKWAESAAMKKWATAAGSHAAIGTCERCGLDATKAGRARFQSHLEALAAKEAKAEAYRCSNPACTTQESVCMLRLKKCSRCQTAMYCRCVTELAVLAHRCCSAQNANASTGRRTRASAKPLLRRPVNLITCMALIVNVTREFRVLLI